MVTNIATVSHDAYAVETSQIQYYNKVTTHKDN